MSNSENKRVLISGGGIAGLTLGIFLHKNGWEPLIIERDPALRTEGYMIDIFGTGWDVAERLGVVDALKAIRYPFDFLGYVDDIGKPYALVPIGRMKNAFGGKYITLRRSDLENILFEKAKDAGISVRFGTVVRSLEDTGSSVEVEFEDNSRDSFSMVFGADGAHSRVRQLVFGPEERFSRFLGAYVAAFHTANKYGIGNYLELFEEIDRMVAVYPITSQLISTMYVFRNRNEGFVPREKRLALVKDKFQVSGWIGKKILEDIDPSTSIFFDSLTQIVMPSWRKNRIALLGDACGCLTLLSGQGAHMAMGSAYVIARELERHQGDYQRAFRAYEEFFRPIIIKKQNNTARFVQILIPSNNMPIWLRRIAVRLLFSRSFIRLMPLYFGSKSVIHNY